MIPSGRRSSPPFQHLIVVQALPVAGAETGGNSENPQIERARSDNPKISRRRELNRKLGLPPIPRALTPPRSGVGSAALRFHFGGSEGGGGVGLGRSRHSCRRFSAAVNRLPAPRPRHIDGCRNPCLVFPSRIRLIRPRSWRHVGDGGGPEALALVRSIASPYCGFLTRDAQSGGTPGHLFVDPCGVCRLAHARQTSSQTCGERRPAGRPRVAIPRRRRHWPREPRCRPVVMTTHTGQLCNSW